MKILGGLACLAVLIYLVSGGQDKSHLDPNSWHEVDKRITPEWYDQSKIGIFIHWGVYSVPALHSEWFWYRWKTYKNESEVGFMEKNYKPGFTYQEFAPMFTAEFFNTTLWADMIEASGAKYVVLTSKHHDGYTLWPSMESPNWNSVEVGPKRDIVGELAKEIRRRKDIRFGLYYSLWEFYHPLFLQDKKNNWTTQNFVNTKLLPEMTELVNLFQPEVFWSDGDWMAPETYWNSAKFLTWLYTKSPVKDTVIVNDRWGNTTHCKHGLFCTGSDRLNPRVLQELKWENCLTLDYKSWGYSRTTTLDKIMPIEELIQTIAESISCGGNILINVGPRPDGRISPIFEERLRQMGTWLKINGEAIYNSSPWTYQNDSLTPGVWYTQRKDLKTIYAIVLDWPNLDELELASLSLGSKSQINMLGVEGNLSWKKSDKGRTRIYFPLLTPNKDLSKWAWVLKISNT